MKCFGMGRRAGLGVVVGGLLLPGTASAEVADFESGRNGWGVNGRTDVSALGGNPGANLDVVLIDVFGADIRQENQAPDFAQPFTLTVDIQTNSMDFSGIEVSRELVVMITDEDVVGPSGPVGVYFRLGEITATVPGWQTYAVTVEDPTRDVLPAGWLGFGDEDPDTFEPMLPAGVTFDEVLAGRTVFRLRRLCRGSSLGLRTLICRLTMWARWRCPSRGCWGSCWSVDWDCWGVRVRGGERGLSGG